jgi:hypothetical protein
MRPRPHPRRAAVLVEFALIALVLILLIAFILDFGRALYGDQQIQQAADLAARELAHASLPPGSAGWTLAQALNDQNVKATIYNDEMLVIPNPGSVNVGDLPVVNQVLYPLMIADQVTLNGMQTTVLRYPGAILQKSNGKFTVGIPEVVGRDASGTETILWHAVLEEVQPSTGVSPFSITSPQRGLVSVRINYPFQGAALTGYQQEGTGPTGQPINVPIQANDGGVQANNQPPGGATPVDPGQAAGPYAGLYGLGKQFALVKTVRPFRKLLSAQAVYRREIFN